MKLEEAPIYIEAVAVAKKYRKIHKALSQSDQYSIGTQMARSSVSIASNIAEGWGRESGIKTKLLFLSYAKGSLYEFRTQLKIVEEDYLEIVKQLEMNESLDNLEKGLIRFTLSLQKKVANE